MGADRGEIRTTRTEDGIRLVALPADGSAGRDLSSGACDRLSRAIATTSRSPVVLDLQGADHLSDRGIDRLVRVLKSARANGSAFKLCSVAGALRERFDLLRLGFLFEVHEDRRDALESLRRELGSS